MTPPPENPAADRRQRLIQRFSWYWPMELWNIVLLPVAALAAIIYYGGWPDAVFAWSVPANVLLLGIGGLYWRAVLHRLQGDESTMAFWLPWFDRYQALSQMLLIGSFAAACALLIENRDLSLPPQRIAAVIFFALALAEYVNYYHVQLQHFDHWADFKRLITGRGFRESWLARDLRLYRAVTSAA
jgi:hypothetical protein